MSLCPLLSRVLPSLTLVVNALAPVVASTRMPASLAPAATAVAHAEHNGNHLP